MAAEPPGLVPELPRDHIRFFPNAAGQVAYFGDSGGPALRPMYAPLSQLPLTGILTGLFWEPQYRTEYSTPNVWFGWLIETMSKATVISLSAEFEKLKLLPDRRPDSANTTDYFSQLSEYRDGAIFITHFAGESEWERHSNGDELVMVMVGETTLVLLQDGEEKPHALQAGEMLVIPQNTWHRFEAPEPIKVMTVTPLPTDHSPELPD